MLSISLYIPDRLLCFSDITELITNHLTFTFIYILLSNWARLSLLSLLSPLIHDLCSCQRSLVPHIELIPDDRKKFSSRDQKYLPLTGFTLFKWKSLPVTWIISCNFLGRNLYSYDRKCLLVSLNITIQQEVLLCLTIVSLFRISVWFGKCCSCFWEVLLEMCLAIWKRD